jgi:hypothetical protein
MQAQVTMTTVARAQASWPDPSCFLGTSAPQRCGPLLTFAALRKLLLITACCAVTRSGGHLGWVSEQGGYFGAPWTDHVVQEWFTSVQVHVAAASLRTAASIVSTDGASRWGVSCAPPPAGVFASQSGAAGPLGPEERSGASPSTIAAVLDEFRTAAGERRPLPVAALRAECRQVVAHVGTPLAGTWAIGRFSMVAGGSGQLALSEAPAASPNVANSKQAGGEEVAESAPEPQGAAAPATGARGASRDAGLGRRQSEGPSSLPAAQHSTNVAAGLASAAVVGEQGVCSEDIDELEAARADAECTQAHSTHAGASKRGQTQALKAGRSAAGLGTPPRSSHSLHSGSPRASRSSPYGCRQQQGVSNTHLRQARQPSSSSSSLWWDD